MDWPRYGGFLKVLAFDVFGTVVDWYGSIAREVQRLRLPVEPGQFALNWRAGYQPAMARVRSGELGWVRIDDLHRMILDELLLKHQISMDEEARRALNLVWHRLTPWPDTVGGLTRLKTRQAAQSDNPPLPLFGCRIFLFRGRDPQRSRPPRIGGKEHGDACIAPVFSLPAQPGTGSAGACQQPGLA